MSFRSPEHIIVYPFFKILSRQRKKRFQKEGEKDKK